MTEEPIISATEPDWSRERSSGGYEPSKKLIAAIRLYQKHPGSSPWAVLQRKRAQVQHRLWSAVCSSDIPISTQIGGGLVMPHPLAIVIHPSAVIGPNCLIFQSVTIGTTHDSNGRAPRIGGHVDIGAGAQVLGDITIGDHAKIGANAVVLTDVPAYGVAVGVPAKVINASRLLP
jgi:serine O-acetyltransferase